MTVLHFQPSLSELNRREVDGVLQFARMAGWNVQVIEYDAAIVNLLQYPRSEEPIDVAKLISFWRPVGCIVDCGGRKRDFTRIRNIGKIPVVYLDMEVDCGVYPDNRTIATFAARELMTLGFDDYAFIPWLKPFWWSEDRRESFAECLKMNGKRLHEYCHKAVVSPPMLQSELIPWIKSLPRPCGVFAVNDFIGKTFISAAICAGYSVPEDFAVVGVDDDVRLCETSAVSLSSIRWDAEKAGYLCAQRLAQMIEDPKRKFTGVCVNALTFTRRASTRLFRIFDRRVQDALEFIRLNAENGIRPSDVVAKMGCSRRLADLRFREVTGRTILDEIHAVRIDRVKALLRRPRLELSAMPYMSGYRSLTDLQRVFKKHTGKTLNAYRKEFAIGR